jgi:hypothetical protein
MGVDDFRAKPARGGDRPGGEARVLRFAAPATRQHRALDRVPAGRKRLFEAADEDAVVGLGSARVHLRDEQDAHGGAVSRFRRRAVTHAGAFKR